MNDATQRQKLRAKIRILCLFVLVVCGVSLSAQPAMADVGYPDNLPVGQYTSAPYSVATYQFTRMVNETKYCETNTLIIIDGDYAHEFFGANNETAQFWIQKPSTNKSGYSGVRNPSASLTSTVKTPTSSPSFGNEVINIGEGNYALYISAYPVEVADDELCSSADLAATRSLFESYAYNTRVWWNGIVTPPSADFDWEVTNPETHEVTFTNLSTTGGGSGSLDYLWEFGDGQTSNGINPVHTYNTSGPFVVKLKATNSQGESDTATQTILEGNLIVNSTADTPAENPELGCSTGNLVGDKPECTLRGAIQASEAKGGGEITFDIDSGGVPSISVTSALPAITKDTSIDATTQSTGQVGLVGPGTSGEVNGFRVTSGKATIKRI